MNMKRFALTTMGLALLLLGACTSGSNEETEPEVPPTPTPEPEPTEVVSTVVQFIPHLQAMTRATDTKFENGDRIGVFAVESSGSDNRAIISDYGNYAQNTPYQYDGNRFIPSSTGIELKDDVKIYYTAVYPYQQNCKNSFDFSVKSDQSDETNYSQSDLCTASTGATNEKVVDLQFSHRLSRIIVNLSGTGWSSSDITVKLKNVMTKTNVNLNDMQFVATGTKSDIICAPNGTLSYKVIFPPQSIGQGEKLFVITMNGADYTLDTPSMQEFRSGKSYEYTLNMDANHEIVEFTGEINPWNVDERINSVVPEDIQEKMEPYIPIYMGNTPPNIEGTVFVDPFSTVYCEDYGNGGYAPGDIVNSTYIRFSNQNTVYNTLDIDQTSGGGTATSTGTGAFISGSGNNFTAFFNTTGQSSGISTKTALVISGTKVTGGIQNLKYAFVLVEKGSDPENKLMKEGVFRVFEDKDGISPLVDWPNSTRQSTYGSMIGKGFSIYSVVE